MVVLRPVRYHLRMIAGGNRFAGPPVEVRRRAVLAAGMILFLVGGVLAPIWALAGGRIPAGDRPFPVWARWLIVLTVAGNWVYLIAVGV